MSPLRVLSLSELRALDLPDQSYVVDGVLPAGALTLLSGREKSGKSLLTTDLLCSIALEEPFLDRAVAPGPVLFVPAEEHLRDVRHRIDLRLAGRDAPVYVLPSNGTFDQRLRIDDPVAMAALLEQIRVREPAAVALDPLIELHEQPENDADAMGPLLRPLRQVAHETGAAVLLLHHSPKGGSGFRGSTAIGGACDHLIDLQRHGDGEDSDQTTARLVIKGRYGPRLRLNVRLGDALRWQAEAPTITVEPGNLRARIIRHLQHTGDWLTSKAIADALSVPAKSVQNLIGPMLQETAPAIVSAGTGTKTDPRRYAAVEPELIPDPEMVPSRQNPRESAGREPFFAPDASRSREPRNDNGNNPYRIVCPDCGQEKTKGIPCPHCAAVGTKGAAL